MNNLVMQCCAVGATVALLNIAFDLTDMQLEPKVSSMAVDTGGGILLFQSKEDGKVRVCQPKPRPNKFGVRSVEFSSCSDWHHPTSLQ